MSDHTHARGNETRWTSCHSRAWLFLAVMLLAGSVLAQVPAIADIPDGLSVQMRFQLAQTRSSLVGRRDQIKVRVAEQRDKCGAVAEGTPEEQTCRMSKTELQPAIISTPLT